MPLQRLPGPGDDRVGGSTSCPLSEDDHQLPGVSHPDDTRFSSHLEATQRPAPRSAVGWLHTQTRSVDGGVSVLARALLQPPSEVPVRRTSRLLSSGRRPPGARQAEFGVTGCGARATCNHEMPIRTPRPATSRAPCWLAHAHSRDRWLGDAPDQQAFATLNASSGIHVFYDQRRACEATVIRPFALHRTSSSPSWPPHRTPCKERTSWSKCTTQAA